MKVLMDSYGFQTQIKHFLQDICNFFLKVSAYNNNIDFRWA